MISLTIDSKDLQAALSKAPSTTKDEIRIELKKQMAAVVSMARRIHRFKRDKGFLQRSIRKKIIGSLVGVTYLEDGIAPYGVFVHDGHGSWEPDLFVYKAFRKKIPEITKGIKGAISRALKKAGL